MNAIERAVDELGGYEATGRICGVSGKAVMKWAHSGLMPRTEWTGETDHTSRILAALSERGVMLRRADFVPTPRGARAHPIVAGGA